MILSRLFEKRATVVSGAHPRDPVLADIFGGSNNTSSGVRVTSDSALAVNAVYAAIRILTDSVSSLPLNLHKHTKDGGNEHAINHNYYTKLKYQPNAFQTSVEWREMMLGHMLLRGNAYSEIMPNGDLIPLHPDRVIAFMPNRETVAYEYTPPEGKARIILSSEMHHLKGFSLDGLSGLNPIETCKDSVGLSKAAEDFGASFYGNGATAGGFITHPGQLSADAQARLIKSFEARHRGAGNAHRPAVLEENMQWQSVGIAPNQAQFLETRRFQIAEIARIFRVPLYLMADLEKATISNVEQQSIDYLRHSLRPLLVRWEQAMRRDLFGVEGKRKFYVEFNVEGILRGDSGARAEFYNKMFSIGTMSQNEIRAFENMPPIPDGDKYYVALNMGNTQGQPAPETDKDKGEDDAD